MSRPSQTPYSGMKPLDDFAARAGDRYSLLPFRYMPLDSRRYLLTNYVGEHLVLEKGAVHRFIRHQLPIHCDVYDKLKARHFLLDGDSMIPVELLAAKYRTKRARLSQFTSLFMLVTTLRCDHSCLYCQVSRRTEDEHAYDMPKDVADAFLDFIFRSPSPAIKIEFQGGESLLAFETVKHLVLAAEARNESEDRDLQFVLTTNLSALTDGALTFCSEHDVYISTSLDGPRDLHNSNRPKIGGDSYEEVSRGIRRVREVLGPHKLSALMTTTRASLAQSQEIVDEYLRQGFSSIFLRTLNPYGRAVASGLVREYTTEEWLQFYKEALDNILKLNGQGVPFREELSAIILRKILTPYDTGYVDLQSPAGIGISGIVINYDGGVYCSDESRMLAEMGDDRFRMGNILTDRYEDIVLSDALLEPLATTMTECVPQCADCGVQPYCGSDPVRHYRTQGDLVGFKPTSDFCWKHMGVITHLVHLLEDDPAAANVLRTWI